MKNFNNISSEKENESAPLTGWEDAGEYIPENKSVKELLPENEVELSWLEITAQKTPEDIMNKFKPKFFPDGEITVHDPSEIGVSYDIYKDVYSDFEKAMWESTYTHIDRNIGEYGMRRVYITGSQEILRPHFKDELNSVDGLFNDLNNDEFHDLVVSALGYYPEGLGHKHPINNNKINTTQRWWVEKILENVSGDLRTVVDAVYNKR